MNPEIFREKDIIEEEFATQELCFILENWNGDKKNVSIARARVEPKVTTKLHYLKGVDEIYLVTEGRGRVKVGNLEPTEVGKGDLVFVPAGTHQQITNIADSDLIFYCICNPRFVPESYVSV